MTKIYGLLVVLFLLTGARFKLYSQNNQYDQGKISYSTSIDYQFISHVDNITDFPKYITNIASDIIANFIGEHGRNFSFKSGSIFKTKNYFATYPDRINQSLEIIPTYVLLYNWSDTSIGVRSYEIYLCLDKLGQVIYFNFPRYYDFDKINLESFDDAISKSDSIISKGMIKYNDPFVEIDYDECENDLAWIFRFDQFSDKTAYNVKEIKIYMISKEIETNDVSCDPLGVIDSMEIEEIMIEDLIRNKNNKP